MWVKKTELWNKEEAFLNIILTPVSNCKEMEVKGKTVLDLQSETEVSFDKNSKSTKYLQYNWTAEQLASKSCQKKCDKTSSQNKYLS